jgi:hypothetical protein
MTEDLRLARLPAASYSTRATRENPAQAVRRRTLTGVSRMFHAGHRDAQP